MVNQPVFSQRLKAHPINGFSWDAAVRKLFAEK